MTKLESAFKAEFKGELEHRFPGCIMFKPDAGEIQGIPDLIFLYKGFWAAFELKQRATSVRRPNQDYYVRMLDEMSFAAFVYPENMMEVLHDLQRALWAGR